MYHSFSFKSMLLGVASLALVFTSCETTKTSQTNQTTTSNSKMISLPVPKRAPGQTDVINLTNPKMDVVRVGFIGLGMRGPGAVERFTHIPGTEIKALCDVVPANTAKTQKILEKAGKPKATEYNGSLDAWKQLCDRPDIDLVYIATDWKHHVPMALYAMEKGKHVAIEVPAAMNMKDIWALIDMSEKTRKHCMMLENCVYDFFEITTLNMAQQGLFGEVLHGEGAYIHNLEDFWGAYWENWRLEYNKEHKGDVYPTHGIGPVCQVMNIHRGDKMNYLVSMDTKAVGGPNAWKKMFGQEPESFANGDHTMTMIRTEKGKTMQIQHDVVSPRPYSRMYQISGTNGFANKYLKEGYLLRPTEGNKTAVTNHENLNAHSFVSDDVKKQLMEKYKPRILKEIEETAKKVGGHGGMDYIMDYRLIYCMRNGLPLDMDVYDMAEWSCLTELTAISIENGSAPVEIPDFTRGGWQKVNGYKFHFAD